MRILPKLGLVTPAITMIALGTTLPAEAITVSQVKAAQTRRSQVVIHSRAVTDWDLTPTRRTV